MLIWILAIVAVLVLIGVGAYNKYIRLKNLNEEGWSGIEVYLQKRLDLIPNLVNTVKGYATHEKETLENVVKLRSQMMSIDTKDIDNIEKIQKIETEIQSSRKYYNGTARDRNTFVETFPNNILGGFLGFKKAEFFNAAEGAEKAPEVKF